VTFAATSALARTESTLRLLELQVNRRLDGLLQGDHLGLVPAPGTEPGEGREYVVGDDVRRIDWNLTARTNVTHVRDTIADRELETWVVVDRTASLDFGTADCEKRDLALASVAAVSFLTSIVPGVIVMAYDGMSVAGLGRLAGVAREGRPASPDEVRGEETAGASADEVPVLRPSGR